MVLPNLVKQKEKSILKGNSKQYVSFSYYLHVKNYLTAVTIQIFLCMAKHGMPLSHCDIVKEVMLCGCNFLFHDFPNKGKIIQRNSEMPLTRKTVEDRVQHMANDFGQQQTIDLQEAACYSMCFDQSTNVNDHARLAAILHYAAGDVMREELVKLRSLPRKTQGINIHNAVIETFLPNDIRSKKVVSITSDGALSMLGTSSGFIQLFNKEAKH